MDPVASQKALAPLLGQTPLIIDPDRDAPPFQEALAKLPQTHRTF